MNDFLDGEFPLPLPLNQWFQAYDGSGKGAVDRQAMPEAYCRPLLGDARSVFLGLNPGVALPKYQYRDGTLAGEIREAGCYSEVYRTTPANREPWLIDFGVKKHHLNRIAFMRRWHDDPSLGDEHMLTFELYPWHSRRVLGAMRPHPDIIESMVFAPIAETGVRHVFAFGSLWLDLLDRLGVRRLLTLGRNGVPYGSRVPSRTVAVYERDGYFVRRRESCRVGRSAERTRDRSEIETDGNA